jgi:hypothetical protein
MSPHDSYDVPPDAACIDPSLAPGIGADEEGIWTNSSGMNQSPLSPWH